MAEIKKMVITNQGREDLITAQAEDRAVNWNTLCVGDGNGELPPVNKEATDLVNQVWSGNLTEKFVDPEDKTKITLHGTVPSEVGDFWIREIGIKNEKGQLVILAETNAFEKVTHETRGILSELDLYFDLKVTDLDAGTIEVTVDSSIIYGTKKDVNDLNQRIDENVQSLENKISENVQNLNNKDTEIENNINENVQKLTDKDTEIVGRLDGIDSEIATIGTRLESLEEFQTNTDSRIENIESQLEGVETSISSINARIGAVV